ncbi:uncharacterized protein LOC127573446 isoform X2 [Pristis pectinata]|nr:uncharacterized protein LOC127573446 isoform X2 [Pristis pectinata]XP_051877637.1 uncharacterized protein LOC127573446 isoform X2 [Pristis pectinata]XP_051877638.1 uncharacterized protein LOC127573446 isoform X2 [Pristis pectinata]
MMSSLSAPKHSASTRDVSRALKNAVPSAAAKENREKGAQCRLPLQNRNVLQNCPEKPLNGLRKNTIDTNDLKSFGKKLSRSSVSNLNNRRFSTGSFNQNSLRKLDRKMDTKFKQAARSEENPLNATFCLPCSDDKRVGNKSLDMVLVQKCLPNIDATSSVPEPELTPSACLPHLSTEPDNLTSFVAEECLHIAAQLSNKSKTPPINIPDALNQCPVSNVSVITEEPLPFDCSVSYCSDSSPAKSPQAGRTSELPGNSLKDTRCQLFNIELKTKDSSFSDKTEDKYIDSETLPFPPGNLIQFDDTTMLSDPNDLEGDAPCVAKLEAYSRNVSQSPTVNNCSPSLGTEDLMTLDGAMVFKGTSTMPSKNEFPDKSAIQAKTLSNLKLSLSKTDMLLCEGSMLSDEILVVPKQSACFGNELQKPTALTDSVQCLTPGDLIQLNEAMTLTGTNTTFNASKHETSFGNDLPASVLPNFKMSQSAKDAVQLNGTMTLFDKNATFDASKHEGYLGNDDKTTASTSCKLSLSTHAEFQSNDIMAGNDSKNTTFDISKHECNLGNDPNNPPSTGDKVQLNDTMTMDQKNATFDASKHECNSANDPNKAVDLEMREDGNTAKLPSCKPFPSSGGSNDLRTLNSKSLKLMRKCEGSALISVTQSQIIEYNEESSNSKDSNTTINFGKDDSKCSIKSEANQGNDGDISSSTEVHKGPSDRIKSPYLRDSMQKEELNVCASADLIHDAMSSEWAPYCMSTPNVAMKLSFLEYPPLDHSFQTSSSTLQDDTHVVIADCPDKQVSKDGSNSGSNENETKSSSGKIINAPRLKEQLQKTKVATASSSKPISTLPVVKRKNVNLAAVSQDKCSGEKKSIPLPGRTTRPSSSSMGRGGRPPIQPPSLPKTRLVLGRPSSVVGTGQSAASNELPSGQMGVDIKVPAKVVTRIPGIKKRSPKATSKQPAQESKKSDSKLVQLFNLGVADPPNANRSAHNPLVLDSKNIVTGIKRPLEQKRQCPSPKRPKAVGEMSAKLPKKSGTKLLPPVEPKHKKGVKGTEKLTSEPKVNMNTSSLVESESKQEQEVAKLQRRIKELEERIVVLELENAALRQKEGLATGI